MFGPVLYNDKPIEDFVACKSCEKVYIFRSSDGIQTLRKHRCTSSNSGSLAKPNAKCNFDWKQAGFTSTQKNIIPNTEIIELNRKVALMCAVDFRPFSECNGKGFELVAQKLVDNGAKYDSVDAKALFNDPTTIS